MASRLKSKNGILTRFKKSMSYKAKKDLVWLISLNIKKLIRPKNLHKVGFENLGIRCIRNLIHDGCLKKKKE